MRELENLIERSLILYRGELLRFENLVSFPSKQVDANTGGTENETLELDALVKRHIQKVLIKTTGKIHGQRGAGELLGVSPDTLYNPGTGAGGLKVNSVNVPITLNCYK